MDRKITSLDKALEDLEKFQRDTNADKKLLSGENKNDINLNNGDKNNTASLDLDTSDFPFSIQDCKEDIHSFWRIEPVQYLNMLWRIDILKTVMNTESFIKNDVDGDYSFIMSRKGLFYNMSTPLLYSILKCLKFQTESLVSKTQMESAPYLDQLHSIVSFFKESMNNYSLLTLSQRTTLQRHINGPIVEVEHDMQLLTRYKERFPVDTRASDFRKHILRTEDLYTNARNIFQFFVPKPFLLEGLDHSDLLGTRSIKWEEIVYSQKGYGPSTMGTTDNCYVIPVRKNYL